jgi:hypothetical protein
MWLPQPVRAGRAPSASRPRRIRVGAPRFELGTSSPPGFSARWRRVRQGGEKWLRSTRTRFQGRTMGLFSTTPFRGVWAMFGPCVVSLSLVLPVPAAGSSSNPCRVSGWHYLIFPAGSTRQQLCQLVRLEHARSVRDAGVRSDRSGRAVSTFPEPVARLSTLRRAALPRRRPGRAGVNQRPLDAAEPLSVRRRAQQNPQYVNVHDW